MDLESPHDPNQVLCSCGRLVRVFPAVAQIVNCTFVADGLCAECQAAEAKEV